MGYVIPIKLILLVINRAQWYNDYIATPPSCNSNCRNYTKEDYLHITPENITVIKLPNNIYHLPVKIKKILNISRDLIEISEYIDEMIEYNNVINKKFYVHDNSKLLHRPIH